MKNTAIRQITQKRLSREKKKDCDCLFLATEAYSEDGEFYENTSLLLAVTYFRKMLHIKCFTGFLIRLCTRIN